MRYFLIAVTSLLLGFPNISSAADPGHDCQSADSYKVRATSGFVSYKKMRAAMVQEIKFASFIEYPPTSKEYSQWDRLDRELAEIESSFSLNVRLVDPYQKILSCYPANIGAEIMPYLYALTNLEIVDNIIFQARGDLIKSCNNNLSVYAPYLNAADAAIYTARNGIKHHAGGIADPPSYYLNMKEIKNVCTQ